MNPDLLAILACPKCETRPPLVQEHEWLVCTDCRWRYPIREGIPHLLVEEAAPPSEKSNERS